MAFSSFSKVNIAGICAVIPDNLISIDSEISFYKNNQAILERNKKILGLGTRCVADDRTSNCDLCEAAAQ